MLLLDTQHEEQILPGPPFSKEGDKLPIFAIFATLSTLSATLKSLHATRKVPIAALRPLHARLLPLRATWLVCAQGEKACDGGPFCSGRKALRVACKGKSVARKPGSLRARL